MKLNFERILTVVFLCAFVVACGVKAPPMAPGGKIPAIVQGLEHRVIGSKLTLNWKSAKEPVDRYVVYRSMESMEKEPCGGCPVIFEKVTELAGDSLAYSGDIDAGYRYVYKVLAKTQSGIESERGMLVRFAL